MKLDELAKLAGVSTTTASYVVNGKAKKYRVSDKTIARVEALIKAYDFKPNAMAAGLRAGKTNTMGLIIPDFENISYAKIANQLEKACRQQGYQLLIACSNDNAENEAECAKHLIRRQVDALFVSSALPEDTTFYAQFEQTPIIGFDRFLGAAGIDNVLTDDEANAEGLAEALLMRQGGQRILFLGALPELPISRAREQGFRSRLSNTECKVDFLYANRFHQDDAAEVCAQWLGKNQMPDALFTTSFTLLQGALKALMQRPGGIPDRLNIATFGQHEMLNLLENPVVCSVQDHRKIVDSLLTIALERIGGKSLCRRECILRQLVFHRWAN
ncbi:LacI family transcriptional regulator [Mesocricetibacter intestinalis]|uniref:LacI family transcriptional regulator n=1 Tax=Mesocricetibacter intestinalis TaxID=1521930 RepID=A0A4R6V7A1_9PAST|nr:catabolite repressor/activator [Mesocricetibacter intestinalis]TDQ57347.1 LacI family transcriptional regulator [Mesocricetibacter intestinalis]